MSPPEPRQLAFDDVVIDFAGRRLLRGGAEQALEPKAFAVLALLAASPGQVFTRDEILDAVWGHRHVTPSVLNRITSLLRQTLGEDAQHPRRLHTVYGVGYRFDLPTPTSAPAPAPAGVVSLDAGAARPPDPPRPSPAAPRGRTRRTAAWLGAVTAAALLLFATLRWSRPHDGTAAPAATSPARPALAVLPFADLSAGQDQAYLADGLAEEILDQLAQSPALRVVGRRSSFSFRGRSTDLRTIGQRLGVAHLLEGSVRRDGERLRVTAQLVRVEDGSQSWSKTYGRELNDVFAVQEEIARDVAMALSVTLDVARFSREQGGTGNVAAYERFLRWRNIVMREEFDFEHDRERLQLAREMVALDPQCVLCWDALAESLGAMAAEIGAAQAGPLRAEARQARERIAAIAPGSWLAKRDRAKALWNEGRYAAAIALAREVVDAGPLTQERVWDYAYMIYSLGHIDDAVALVEQVRAVEPMALFLSRDLQFDYTAARRYRDAEAEYRRGQSLEGSQAEPDYVAFFRHLAGQRPGGIAELRELHARLLRQNPDLDTPFFRELGAVLDDREALLARVRRVLAGDSAAAGAYPAYVALNLADALGDADLAAAALRRFIAFRTRDAQGGEAGRYPYVAFWNAPYSALRAHPDFKALLLQAGVVDYWRQTGRWGYGCAPLGTEDFRCR